MNRDSGTDSANGGWLRRFVRATDQRRTNFMMNQEDGYRIASRMQSAADTASVAADRNEQAAHRIACLLEDGYGGNGLRLIEQLEKLNTTEAALKALMAIKELIIKGDYSDERALELIAEGVAGKP
jgi:hypothetical protein